MSIVFIIGELLARWNQAVEIEYAAEEGSDRLLPAATSQISDVLLVGVARSTQKRRQINESICLYCAT